jgi:O-antigen/teichoic acid export membrane protein
LAAAAHGEDEALADAEGGLPAARPAGKSSSLVFLISLATQLIGFVATIALVRTLAPDNAGKTLLGLASFFLLLGSSINWIGDLRVNSGFVFFVARGRSPQTSTGTYLALRLALVAAFSVGALAVGYRFWASGPTFAPFAVFMVMPLLWSVSTVFTWLWVAQGDSGRAQIPLLVESSVRTAALLIVAFLAWRQFGSNGLSGAPASYAPVQIQYLWWITLAYLGGAAASALYSARSVFRYVGPFDRSFARQMLVYAWPLMGSLILQFLASNSPSFLVYGILSAASLTLFLAANGFRIFLLSIALAIMTPLFPLLTNLHARGQHDRVRIGVWTALRYTAMFVVPGAAVLTVYRVPFLNIFYHGSFVPAATALALLAIAAIPMGLSWIIGTGLNAVGHQRLELYVSSVQVGSLIALTAVLAPSWSPVSAIGLNGLNGAAAAVLLSSLAAFSLNVFFMERLLAVRIQSRTIGTIVLSAAASFFAVSRLNDYVPVTRYYVLAAVVVVGYAVYFLVLAAAGELTRSDVRRITEAGHLPAGLGRFLARFCWKERQPEETGLIPGGTLSSGPPIPGDPTAPPKGPAPLTSDDSPGD